jgi:hypothetical protein
MSRLPMLFSILALAAAPSVSAAADREVTVKFKPGATSADYRDKTQGYDMVSYFLDARAGQTLAITFEAGLGSCDFVVQRPEGQGNLSDSHVDPDVYTVTLQDTGLHRVNVFLMRATARRGLTCKYTIGFVVRD